MEKLQTRSVCWKHTGPLTRRNPIGSQLTSESTFSQTASL